MTDNRLTPLYESMKSDELDAVAFVPGPNFRKLFVRDFHLMERPLVVIVPLIGDPVAIVPNIEMASFEPIEFPFLFIERPMNAEGALNYLRTWSAVKNYKLEHNNEDPLLLIQEEFFKVWGDIQTEKIIKHPLVTKVFRIV